MKIKLGNTIYTHVVPNTEHPLVRDLWNGGYSVRWVKLFGKPLPILAWDYLRKGNYYKGGDEI